MNIRPWTWTTALLMSLGLTASLAAFADDEEEDEEEGEEEGEHEGRGRFGRGSLASGVAPVSDALTAAECGSCHMAYAPGLLPARSWVALMGGLGDHFGDVAELPQAQVQAITRYLVSNAADTRPDHAIAARVAASVDPYQTPLRILEVPWLRHEHDEIPARLGVKNPEVGSMSNCATCHPSADQGTFQEDDVRIPGGGRWE